MAKFTDLPLELRELIYEQYFLDLLFEYPPEKKLFAPCAPLLASNMEVGFEAAKAAEKILAAIHNDTIKSLEVSIDEWNAYVDTNPQEDELKAKHGEWEAQFKDDCLPLRRAHAMLAALDSMLEGERELDELTLNERF